MGGEARGVDIVQVDMRVGERRADDIAPQILPLCVRKLVLKILSLPELQEAAVGDGDCGKLSSAVEACVLIKRDRHFYPFNLCSRAISPWFSTLQFP